MRMFFWIRRFAIALLCAVTLIALGQVLLRGRPLDVALPHALMWGIITASIYVAALLYHVSRGRRCALCQDTSN